MKTTKTTTPSTISRDVVNVRSNTESIEFVLRVFLVTQIVFLGILEGAEGPVIN